MARTSATPKPVVTQTVCSLCGLDWHRHPENASALDCIELLKADAAKPKPVVVPWQVPYTYPITKEVACVQPSLTWREGKTTLSAAARY